MQGEIICNKPSSKRLLMQKGEVSKRLLNHKPGYDTYLQEKNMGTKGREVDTYIQR